MESYFGSKLEVAICDFFYGDIGNPDDPFYKENPEEDLLFFISEAEKGTENRLGVNNTELFFSKESVLMRTKIMDEEFFFNLQDFKKAYLEWCDKVRQVNK